MSQPPLTLDDVTWIVGDVSFSGFLAGTFHVGLTDGAMYVQHRYERSDALSGEPGEGRGRKWLISKYATKSEIVLTCLKSYITNAEHEARESFRYKAKPIFQPHIDVDALLAVCDSSDARSPLVPGGLG